MNKAQSQVNLPTQASKDYQEGGFLVESQSLRTKNLIFAIALSTIQVFFCWIYGFLVYCPPSLINVTSILIAVGLAILIIVGFGLLFGYTKKLVWSGIGFNLFIFALCIETYPLINDFWTKTGIQTANSPMLNFTYNSRYYNLYLSNRETSPTTNPTYYGNCLTNAMKCSLALVAAFSSILGRAGQLQCLIVTLVGIVGFELNRQIIQQNIGADAFGTFFIFTFGGFMGLALGFFQMLRQRKVQNTILQVSLRKYNGSQQSVLYSILGALFIFAFFPLLAFQIDAYIYQSNFASYTMPLCLILGMGAGVVGGVLVSIMYNGYLIARDATHGVVAGAIVAGASSLYLLNPSYALIAGGVGGFIQALIQNIFERKGIQKRWIVSTVSWSLFGIQGLLGGIFAAAWKKVATNNWSSTFSTGNVLTNYGQQFQFYSALVSAGIGLGFGILAGVIIYLTNFQNSNEYFQDGYYWRNSDCIRTVKKEYRQPQKLPSEYRQPQKLPSEKHYIYCEQGEQEEVYNKHAYL